MQNIHVNGSVEQPPVDRNSLAPEVGDNQFQIQSMVRISQIQGYLTSDCHPAVKELHHFQKGGQTSRPARDLPVGPSEIYKTNPPIPSNEGTALHPNALHIVPGDHPAVHHLLDLRNQEVDLR